MIKCKTIAIILLIFLIILSTLLVVQYNSYMNEKKKILDDFKDNMGFSIINIRKGLGMLDYLMSKNASRQEIDLTLWVIGVSSYDVYMTYESLYQYTNNPKYQKLSSIFYKLFDYAFNLIGDETERKIDILNRDHEVLVEIEITIYRLLDKYGYKLELSTDEELDQLLELMNQLYYH